VLFCSNNGSLHLMSEQWTSRRTGPKLGRLVDKHDESSEKEKTF